MACSLYLACSRLAATSSKYKDRYQNTKIGNTKFEIQKHSKIELRDLSKLSREAGPWRRVGEGQDVLTVGTNCQFL
jgi:hypothetical protein